MSNGFTFNVEEAVEHMEYCTVLDLAGQQLTVYGVVCLNEDHASSHGGQIVSTIDGLVSADTARGPINEAIAEAVDANLKSPDGHPCRYVPVAMSLPTHLLRNLLGQVYRDITPDQLVMEVEKLDDDDK